MKQELKEHMENFTIIAEKIKNSGDNPLLIGGGVRNTTDVRAL